MLTSDQKGAIAETAIIHAAIKLGVNVYTPVVEGGRYDMIFEVGSNLLRIGHRDMVTSWLSAVIRQEGIATDC
jgi:hypothetical protein